MPGPRCSSPCRRPAATRGWSSSRPRRSNCATTTCSSSRFPARRTSRLSSSPAHPARVSVTSSSRPSPTCSAFARRFIAKAESAAPQPPVTPPVARAVVQVDDIPEPTEPDIEPPVDEAVVDEAGWAVAADPRLREPEPATAPPAAARSEGGRGIGSGKRQRAAALRRIGRSRDSRRELHRGADRAPRVTPREN